MAASSLAGVHNRGATFAQGSDLGLNPGLPVAPASARGNQTMTRLFDGTWLVLGDSTLTTTYASGYVYTER